MRGRQDGIFEIALEFSPKHTFCGEFQFHIQLTATISAWSLALRLDLKIEIFDRIFPKANLEKSSNRLTTIRRSAVEISVRTDVTMKKDVQIQM